MLERKNLMKSQADGMSRLDKLQYELKMKSVALQDQLKDLQGVPVKEEKDEEKSIKKILADVDDKMYQNT